MTLVFGDLLDDSDWVPMGLDQQANPSYFWNNGGSLRDAPVDSRATFEGHMFVTTKPMDEMLFVLAGEYYIEHYDNDEPETVTVRAGEVFVSRAGTAYTMTAGNEGVTYIETWPRSVRELETYWHDYGWAGRDGGSR